MYSFWYIPVYVKANVMWNLLTLGVRRTCATVNFIQRKENEDINRQFQATWVNPDIDDPSVTLRIGSKREIRIATETGFGILMPIDEMLGDGLSGNQDILLSLDDGNRIFGQWLFERAMVEGVMREVSPVNLENYR